eukprot:gene5724-6152_t
MKWIFLIFLQFYGLNKVCQSFPFDRLFGINRFHLSSLFVENNQIDSSKQEKGRTRSSIFRKKKKNEQVITKDQSNEKKESAFDFLSDEDREILAKYDRSAEGNARYVAGYDDDDAWKELAIKHFGFIEVPTNEEGIYAYNNETFDQMVEQSKIEMQKEEEKLAEIQKEIDAKSFQKEIQNLNPTSFIAPFSHHDYSRPIHTVYTWSSKDVITSLISFLKEEYLYPSGTMNEDLPRSIFLQLKELCETMKTWKLDDIGTQQSKDPINVSDQPIKKDLTFYSPVQVQRTFLSIFSSRFAKYQSQRTSGQSSSTITNEATSPRIPDPFLSIKLGILKQSLSYYEMIIPRYFEFLDHSMDEENSRDLFLQRLQQLLTFLSKPELQKKYQLYMSQVTEQVLNEPNENKLTKQRRQERRYQAFLDYLNQEVPLNHIKNAKGITSLKESSSTLHWFPSSFSEKMVADFIAIHALLSTDVINEVILHVLPSYDNQQAHGKYFPFFDSLPSEDDVLLLFDFFGNPTNSDIWTIRNFGNQLKQFYFSGRLRILPSDQWKSDGDMTAKNEIDCTIIRNKEISHPLSSSEDEIINLS